MIALEGLLIGFLLLQSTEELEERVRQLTERRQQLQSDLAEIEASLKEAERELNKAKAAAVTTSGQSVHAVVATDTALYEIPKFKRRIFLLPEGTEVILGDLADNEPFIEAVVDGTRGFLSYTYLKKEPLVTAYIDGLVEAKREEREAQRGRQKQEKMAAEQKAKEARLAAMIKKWGRELGTIIAERKVTVRMTQEQVIDAWGKPKDINKTISANRVHEQWVYGLGSYLYFEQGILKTIQN